MIDCSEKPIQLIPLNFIHIARAITDFAKYLTILYCIVKSRGCESLRETRPDSQDCEVANGTLSATLKFFTATGESVKSLLAETKSRVGLATNFVLLFFTDNNSFIVQIL